jgi:sugar phosphate isomerase/epimerase
VADTSSDNDLGLGEIEFFAGWAVPGAESTIRATLENVRELAASTGGGDHLSSGDFVGGQQDIDGAGTRLNSAAQTVADLGLNIAVEAFAWSAINSVPTTSALLARADAHNAGHLLDVWHFYNTRVNR